MDTYILLQGYVFPVSFNFLEFVVCFLMKKMETNIIYFTPPPLNVTKENRTPL